MTAMPKMLIAHWPGLSVYSDEDLAEMSRYVEIMDLRPVGDWSENRASALLAQVDVVLGHWGCPRIDRAVLERAPGLGLFAYAAGTVKAIIDDSIFDRGVRVTSGANANAEPVAEYTLAAVLMATKRVLWRRVLEDRPPAGAGHDPDRVPIGNWDKSVGIVAASLVGRRLIELLRPFPHITVSLYDPYISTIQAQALGVRKVDDLDELCAGVDILSIHAPDLPATRHLIGARQLAQLRDGATLINTARPALVDQDALIDELRTGRLFAILDVTDPEPVPSGHPLLLLPNAFVTPHLAGSQGTELRRLAANATEEIRRWTVGEAPVNGVSREQLTTMA